MNLSDIDRLAVLGRLDIPTEEKETVLRDLTAIIGYIDQIQSVQTDQSAHTSTPLPRNIFRADENPNDPGACTDALLDQMPDHEDTFLKVPRIL
jgi:aspartyl-tRNA(Asn)/glutamyl-tRNA(Gln) amidotransferase subunit C